MVVFICGFVFVPHSYCSVDNSSPVGASRTDRCLLSRSLVWGVGVGPADGSCPSPGACLPGPFWHRCVQAGLEASWLQALLPPRALRRGAPPEEVMLGVVPSVWGRGHRVCPSSAEKPGVGKAGEHCLGAGQYTRSETSPLKRRAAVFRQR